MTKKENVNYIYTEKSYFFKNFKTSKDLTLTSQCAEGSHYSPTTAYGSVRG